MYSNYIVDQNRFSLAGPPRWWLKQLYEFDNSLVVVPSRQDCVYRLAQRRKLKLPEKLVNDALFKQSDTQMLATYGLVPVTTIIATANWSNPYMFVELAQRAPWRQGGADKVNEMLEARDEQIRLDTQAQIDENLTYLGKDAWRFYLQKLGLRSHMWSPSTASGSSKSNTPAIRTTNKTVPNVTATSIFSK